MPQKLLFARVTAEDRYDQAVQIRWAVEGGAKAILIDCRPDADTLIEAAEAAPCSTPSSSRPGRIPEKQLTSSSPGFRDSSVAPRVADLLPVSTPIFGVSPSMVRYD